MCVLPSYSFPVQQQTPVPGSKNEQLKAASQGLAGNLSAELNDPAVTHLSEDSLQLLKFHGSYQQDDRDKRLTRRKAGLDRDWSFMVRTKHPGGRMTAEQYLLADELSTSHGNGSIRVTTRQDLQFHGIGKDKLKPLIRALNERWLTTYGACGDIARNVMTCPVADLLPGPRTDFQGLAQQISDRYLADSTAYYELWLDGEKFMADGSAVNVTPHRDESFYGTTYMPRKHKMAVGLPHDNCIDVLTNDLALEAVLGPRGGLKGYNLLAGGGLGTTHGQTETITRLADRIGFLKPEQAMAGIDAASALYRDFGDRSDRRHARMKYILADRGVEWFREEMSRRLGFTLPLPAEVADYEVDDHLGWHRQRDGRWLVGLWIENGRIKDTDTVSIKSGLRAIVAETKADLRLTAQQNVILVNIPEDAKPRVEALLQQYGLVNGGSELSTLRRFAMACPALPTCGLAVAESERYLPNVIGELEERGYGNERVWIRMSGCPNGCSRPPTAEIGIVGRSLGLYNVYTGGSFEGTRLSRLYAADVRSANLVDTLTEMLDRWRRERRDGEAFGDWANVALFSGEEVLVLA